MAKIIIIGSNHAGTAAANSILAKKKDELVIYDENSNISFLGCGMALWIGKQISTGDGLFYASPEGLEAQGATVHMEACVQAVDLAEKRITGVKKNGEAFEDHYDKLILATGSKPNGLPIPGMELENVQKVKLYQHAKEVIERLDDTAIQKVAVIGGGYLGVELAEAFRRLNKEVTLIDFAPRIMAGYFDKDFTDPMEAKLKEQGIRLALGECCEALLGQDGKVTAVKTDQGSYEADMVLCCVGFKANSSLAPELERYTNGAYLVDKQQRTSDPNVYAIGDCATVFDNARQREHYIALATNAVRSGLVAASNASGTPLDSLGVQGSSGLSIYGLKMVCTGMSLAAAEREGLAVAYSDFEDLQKPAFMEVENPKVKIRIVYRKEDRVVVGCQLISNYDMSAAIHLFSLAIQEQVTVDRLALLDIFFMPHFNQPYNYITMAALGAK